MLGTGIIIIISVFTFKGQFLTSFGQIGEGPREFRYPRELAVDISGVVYVCDLNNNRIQCVSMYVSALL